MNVAQKLNTNNIMNAVTSTLKQSRDVAIANQKGNAVLTVLRTAIEDNPLVPKAIKDFILESQYGDVFLGFALNVAAQTFTENTTILKAAKATNLVGTYDFSENFTQLVDVVESTITGILAPLNGVLGNLKSDD